MSQDCTCSPSSIPATTPSLTRYGVQISCANSVITVFNPLSLWYLWYFPPSFPQIFVTNEVLCTSEILNFVSPFFCFKQLVLDFENFLFFLENSASLDVFSLLSILIFHSPSLHCQVSILRSTTIILSPTTEMDVALQFRGFIHPLWGAPPPASAPTETVSMWARIQRLHFEARMAAGPNSSQLVRHLFGTVL